MKRLLMFIILISGIFLATSAFAWTSWSISGGFSNGRAYYGGNGYCVNPPFYNPVYIQPVVPIYYGRPMYYSGGHYHRRPPYKRPYNYNRRYYGNRYHVPYYKRPERYGGYPRNPGPRHHN